MSIRVPAANLAAPNTTNLRAGDRLHRVHDRNYASNAFNPCQGGAARFAPIKDASGQCIASLYAGSSFVAAVYETIFHDVPAKAKLKSVPRGNVQARAHGELEAVRDMKLASLRAADLKKWRMTRGGLIASSPKLYRQTAPWAKAIHDQFTDLDGLVWTSNQCDPDSAYLFFGDRVSAADFTVVVTRDGITDKGFLADVRIAGRRGGIIITQ